MCGVAGSLNLNTDINAALSALTHRGPDDQESIIVDNLQLAHTRLAVIDAKGGVQPMSLGPLVIVYNGEIYNHLELRTKFNLQCKTGSDTETLLSLYNKVGTDCLNHLDGMFAFAIYDKDKKQLILARDRAGEKPLYVYHEQDKLAFASELNALKSMVDLQIDEPSINHYLNTGFQYQEQTPYKNVFELKPGGLAHVDTTTGKIQKTKWHFLQLIESKAINPDNEKTLLSNLDALLHQSVKDRLLSSDLEVGCFLSGGIDSGLVTSIASKYTKQLKTFTVAFDGQFNEAPLAESVARRYSTNHSVLNVNFDHLEQDIEKIILAYGEPNCDDSIIPSWYVCEAAKQHVTVVLTGDGADELFGGYRRYVPFAHLNLIGNQGSFISMFASAVKYMPAPKNKMSRYNYLYRLADMLNRSGLERFLSSMVNVSTEGLLTKDHLPQLVNDYERLEMANGSSLSKIMLMDFNSLMPGSVLPKMDIASMSHSLETRAPFFSNEVMNFSTALPDTYKIRGNTTKYLLRQLSQRYLPKDVVDAPKRGFETPLVDWVDGTLKAPIFDTLNNNAFVQQFYEPGTIAKLLNKQTKITPQQRARSIWMLYVTEVWAQNAHCKNAT